MVGGRGMGVPYCMSVVKWWVEFPVVWGRGWGIPLVYEFVRWWVVLPVGLG